MNDAGIIDLYWQRSERAIPETENAYGPYCHTVAYNLLRNAEDAEESVKRYVARGLERHAAGAPEQSEGVSRPDHAQYFRNAPAPQRKPKARRRGSEPCDRRALRVPAGRERSGADGGKPRASPEH